MIVSRPAFKFIDFSICDLIVFSHKIAFFCSGTHLLQEICLLFEFIEVFSKVEDCFIELLLNLRKLHIDILFYLSIVRERSQSSD